VQDENGIVRTWGDVQTRKRYSHIDLIHMIDGFDGERGASTAGGRGYYLKVVLTYVTLHCVLINTSVTVDSPVVYYSVHNTLKNLRVA